MGRLFSFYHQAYKRQAKTNTRRSYHFSFKKYIYNLRVFFYCPQEMFIKSFGGVAFRILPSFIVYSSSSAAAAREAARFLATRPGGPCP
jgi:hypothetical protein